MISSSKKLCDTYRIQSDEERQTEGSSKENKKKEKEYKGGEEKKLGNEKIEEHGKGEGEEEEEEEDSPTKTLVRFAEVKGWDKCGAGIYELELEAPMNSENSGITI